MSSGWKYKDRVLVESTTTGTGDFTLGAAVSNLTRGVHRTFADAGYVNGDKVKYVIQHTTALEVETGRGTIGSSGQLKRDIGVNMSSNANALVSFSAGTKHVYVTLDEKFAGEEVVHHEEVTATGSIGYNAFSYGAGEDYLLVGSNLKYDGSGGITRYSTSEQAAGFEVGQYSFSLIYLTSGGVQSSPWAWNAVTNVIEVSSWLGIKKNAAPADGDIDTSEGIVYWQNTVGNARPIHRGKDSAGTAVTRTPANLEQANEHSARNKFPATYGDITTDADAATITIDWSAASRRKITLTANRTITFSNEIDGQSVVIIFISGGTGAFVPVWPVGIRWQGGAAPTLTNTSGRRDLVGIYRESSGNYIGTFASDFY